jgi:hypothetical protein
LFDRFPEIARLVSTLERWDRLALSLIQSVSLNGTVAKLDLAVGLLLPGEGVLHPVLVVTVGVVLTGVSTTGLLTGSGGSGSLGTVVFMLAKKTVVKMLSIWRYVRASQKVAEFEGLNKIGVPDHAAVLGANLGVELVDSVDLLDTLVQALLGTENADISLHGLLHGVADFVGRLRTLGSAGVVEVLDGLGTGVGSELLVGLAGSGDVTDTVRHSATEDDQIKQGVGTQAVSTVDGHTGGLTTGVQTRNDLLLAVLIHIQDLTSVLGGDTTHVVVDGGQDGNGLLSDIDTGENGGGLGDTGQTLVEKLSGQVAELEVDVVLLGSDTTALTDLQSHGTGNNVTRGKILGGGSVTLHETLTLGVEQVTTLTTGTLGDQTTGTVDTSWVELNELQILVRKTSTSDHGHTVTGTGVGGSAREVGTSITTGSQDGVVGLEAVQSTILLVVGNDTTALTILHQQVEGEVFDEVVGVVTERLSVESVQKSVTGTISGSGATVGLATLTELLGLTTESTLVDTSILGTGEGATVTLKLANTGGGLAGHVVNGVLVTKPIGTLHGIVHVPSPVILVHAKGPINTD